jgi:putative DeoR family transcriptional regulator (stage III sporulation protein D)
VWQYIEERVRAHAEYILETGETVRACAVRFQTSKSTVHKDLTERLQEYDPALYAAVRKVLDKNLRERHIRGGIATKQKYQKIREAHTSSKNKDKNTD